MVKSKHRTVEEVLNAVDEDKKPLVKRLRELVKGNVPKVVESVRSERITYALNDKDIAALRVTKQHVDLLFLRGKSLSSTQLKGQGTIGDPKHLEVYNLKNFDDTEAKRLLKEEAATVQTA
ncbi:MAG: DUF1801 domain-containing protein [Candidatus Bathyarchaeota archaeon]|nr:DUF1801 domain-containing protein [Candidatus Bathyarchaeota archaeon]